MSIRKNAFRPVILYNKEFQHQKFIHCVVMLTIQHSTEISFAYSDMRQFSQEIESYASVCTLVMRMFMRNFMCNSKIYA